MSEPDKTERQQAAVNALIDWSKWLVTLQPAGILTITGIFKLDPRGSSFSGPAKTLLIVSLVCVVFSLVAATFALGGLPNVIQRLPSNTENGIYGMTVYRKFRVGQIVFIEHLFFVFGIALFAGFLCITIFNYPSK